MADGSSRRPWGCFISSGSAVRRNQEGDQIMAHHLIAKTVVPLSESKSGTIETLQLTDKGKGYDWYNSQG